jgi:hypothetical protein
LFSDTTPGRTELASPQTIYLEGIGELRDGLAKRATGAKQRGFEERVLALSGPGRDGGTGVQGG